jgi:hypothetical protein
MIFRPASRLWSRRQRPAGCRLRPRSRYLKTRWTCFAQRSPDGRSLDCCIGPKRRIISPTRQPGTIGCVLIGSLATTGATPNCQNARQLTTSIERWRVVGAGASGPKPAFDGLPCHRLPSGACRSHYSLLFVMKLNRLRGANTTVTTRPARGSANARSPEHS